MSLNKYNYIQIEKRSQLCFYIDDYKNWKLNKSIIFNWTVGQRLNKKNYFVNEKYAALRSIFSIQKKKKISNQINTIFIFFGSNDNRNITIKILNYLLKKFGISKEVILILSEHKYKIFKRKFTNFKNIKIYKNLNEYKIKSLLGKSDLAISSGGQILYELANIGVPTVCYEVEKNTLQDIKGFENKKFLINLGKFKEKNYELKLSNSINYLKNLKIREKMSKIGQKTIDGKGALRISSIINNFIIKNE